MKAFDELEVIGNGAFGVVTKCKNREDGRLVAIKRMKQTFASFNDCLLLKEVKSLRKIKHENVIRMLQVFRENDHLYLVFELLQGSLLKSIQGRFEPFSEEEVQRIVFQMLEGLQVVHKQGFFHRDIKPENLMWSLDEAILKIGDFGLAREIRSRPPYTEYVGSRWYRAPELLLRHEFYNSPVDIWAVGAIMVELFTLKPLFQGSSETDQMIKIFNICGTPSPTNWPDGVRLLDRMNFRVPHQIPVGLSNTLPHVSSEALDLAHWLLVLDPAKRPNASQALKHPFFLKTFERSATPLNISMRMSTADFHKAVEKSHSLIITSEPDFDDIFENL